MKYLKMLGLAMVTAAAMVATAGPGTASATVLCKETLTPCPEIDRWPVGTMAKGSLKNGTTAIFRSTSGTIEETCTEATISGTLGNAGSGSETVRAKGGPANVQWGGCTSPMTTVHGGEIELHHIAGTDNGTVTVKEFETTMTVFGVSCTFGYGTGTDIGVATGGSSPSLDVNFVLNKTGGSFLCPADVVAEAKGVLTEPVAGGYVEDQ